MDIFSVTNITKLYYPVNGIFLKILPKNKFFKAFHEYCLHIIANMRYYKICKIAKKEILKINKANPKSITLVWDCLTSPVTYGDFIDFCFYARYLAFSNCSINFYIINDRYRSEWDIVYPGKNQKENFIKQLKDIANFLIPDTKIHTIKNFSNLDFNCDTSFTVFLDKIKSRDDFYLFKYIEVMTELQCMQSSKHSFLLDSKYYGNTNGIKDYICWHIRTSSTLSSDEDELPEDISKYYDIISSETNLPIIIISNMAALHNLKNILGNKSNVHFSKDIDNDFLSDLKIIIGSKIYIQCGWGGAFTVPICSKIPFLGPPIERVQDRWQMLKPHVKNYSNIRPWATQNQMAFNSDIDFQNKLSKILERI